MEKIAVYPGSFDPVTNGHVDIIKRSAFIFSEVIVAVFINPGKNPTFSIKDRVKMLQEATKDIPNVRVDSFSGLLTEYARAKGAHVIIRGLRALADFEKEFQQALMYKKLNEDVEILFLMTSQEYSFLSSSLVKEVASFGGSIENLVPEFVDKYLKDYFS